MRQVVMKCPTPHCCLGGMPVWMAGARLRAPDIKVGAVTVSQLGRMRIGLGQNVGDRAVMRQVVRQCPTLVLPWRHASEDNRAKVRALLRPVDTVMAAGASLILNSPAG